MINSRKQSTQEALAQSRALLESIGDGVIATGDDGRILYVNKSLVKMLGYTEKELMNAWFPEVIQAVNEQGQKIELTERPIARAILSREPVNQRSWYIKKDGTLLPVAITVAPTILNGRPVGAVETVRDITEELRVESMKDEFISVASHQLRTPLTAIKIHAEILYSGLRGKLSEAQSESMNNIVESAERMADLIDTLLNIARLESGRIEITCDDINIKDLIETIVNQAKHNNDHPELRIDFVDKTENLQTVYTDPVLIHEAISNLVSNAVKYTPSPGNITVTLTQNESTTCIAVQDTGYGIPKTELKNIYSKFFRGSNIVTEDTTGTGLGLYMVKKISDSLGAKVSFKSRENKGTTFTLELANDSQ